MRKYKIGELPFEQRWKGKYPVIPPQKEYIFIKTKEQEDKSPNDLLQHG